MENNNIQYKWTKILASKRFHTEDGVISLSPEEQQELLDDISKLREFDLEKERLRYTPYDMNLFFGKDFLDKYMYSSLFQTLNRSLSTGSITPYQAIEMLIKQNEKMYNEYVDLMNDLPPSHPKYIINLVK